MRVLPGVAIHCAVGGNAQDARFTRGGFLGFSVYFVVQRFAFFADTGM